MRKRKNIKDVFERLKSEDDRPDIEAEADDAAAEPDRPVRRRSAGASGKVDVEPDDLDDVTDDDIEPDIDDVTDDDDDLDEDMDAEDIDDEDLDSDLDDEDLAEDFDAEFDDDDTTPTSRARRRVRLVVVIAACLIFVAALALSGVLGWQLKQRDAIADASREALDTAKNYAVTLSSIETKDIDKNFGQVLDGATGEFKDMYSQSSAQLRQLLIDNQAVSRGVVVEAGVQSATRNKVEILLFIDQSISNKVTPQPRLDRLRMAMTMERLDNRWLASHIEIT